MRLKHLELTHFRNYEALALDFSARKVILLGDNAQGKSNLLEAIGLLATGRSATAQRDAEMVQWGAEQAIIRSQLDRELSDLSVDMLIRTSGRRAVRVNGVHQKRLSDLFGKVLAVIFRSEDLHLVKGGPAQRRDYLDGMLVQISNAYYQNLHDYERVLHQRNSLLRSIGEGQASLEQLEGWDEQLARLASGIWLRRFKLLEALEDAVTYWYSRIAEAKEVLSMRYMPSLTLGDDATQWPGVFNQALKENRNKEIRRGQTLLGPHRDDLELLIDARPARAFGSQGQQRTVVLSLKLAELGYVRDTAGEAPLLLLDDVLAELDVGRQNALLASIGDEVQVFVTSTHLNDFSAEWIGSADIYQVEAGHLRKMKSGKTV